MRTMTCSLVILMPDTLKGFVQLMDGLPDNNSKLINPQNAREAILSSQTDRGAAFADAAAGPWTVTIPAQDVWVDIPLAVGVAMTQSPAVLFWRMDGNGQLFYDYTADWPTTIVPGGYTRSVAMTAVIGLDPNNNTYEFSFTIAGVTQEPVEVVETASTTDAVTVTLIAGQGIDVSVAPVVSVQVRNIENADDLSLLSFAYRVTGGVLA